MDTSINRDTQRNKGLFSYILAGSTKIRQGNMKKKLF